MNIIIPSIRDTGGTGWNLAHAINNVSEHRAIDITAQKSYINYPTMCHMGDYSKALVRKMIYKADTVAIVGSFRPLFDGLNLKPKKLEDKKKLLIFMGSEWRNGRAGLLQHADKYMRGPYKMIVGSPCMMMPGEDEDKTPCPSSVEWLPLTRGFTDIRAMYGMCNQDKQAIDTFGATRDKVAFMHAPTSEERKGSQTFYYAMTRAQQLNKKLIFSMIRGQPWINCLKSMAVSDLLFDQNPPFPETYGGIAVEASIFKLPIISRISQYAMEFWKKETGLDCPVIQWKDDDELFKKVYYLSKDRELREKLGDECHRFMKTLHDEKPVVDRFFKLIEDM